MKLSAFQKAVYYLSFVAIVLSTIASIVMLPFENISTALSYGFLTADFAIIILIKFYYI